jgi:Aldo/keto reductase family
VLTEIAEAHHATPRQIALAFLTLRPSVFAIPKASSVDHVEENAGAYRLLLSSADRQLKMSDARGRMEGGGNTMITVALLVLIEAKPGQERGDARRRRRVLERMQARIRIQRIRI